MFKALDVEAQTMNRVKLGYFRLCLQREIVQCEQEIATLRSSVRLMTSRERGDAARQLSDLHVHLMQLEDALDRVNDGSYGWCLRCGSAIDPTLLEWLPYLALCESCSASAPPHLRQGG